MAVNKTAFPKVRTDIGSVNGKQLRFLAHVSVCAGDDCPMRAMCPYKPEGKCTVIYSFLKSLYSDWVDPRDGVGDILTQIQLDRIGTHLMPLYHQLAKFALEISALGNTSYENKQGTWMTYPQFAELRAVLKEIRSEMKDLKLDQVWEKKFGNRPSPNVDDFAYLDDIMQTGRPRAYEEMVERAKIGDKQRIESEAAAEE